ncbi:cell division protein ZapA [Ectothiorhodospiraceae bacterium BW-2]|nr:cell division protein ZapA [Ectothiorhodospiraceae bacterium BW-2]
MSSPINQEQIYILDKSYTIACTPEERLALLESAAMLDDRMRHIRDTDKIVGTERIAVIAALNIAHELLLERRSSGSSPEVAEAIVKLSKKIEKELKQN